MVRESKAVIFIDGASRGNPGPAAAGIVFQDSKGKVLRTVSKSLGISTNNVAEYCALVLALQEALMMRLEELEIFTDSELLTKQFNGEYKIKEPFLKVLFSLVQHLRQGFKKISLTHVVREKNKLADKEANKALDRVEFLL